ncbi:MAG: GerMN domain-containing protein [candidate division NC10 bacterium]|nr:GerMN domain-containing protein [candidate division NC10 bacterium]
MGSTNPSKGRVFLLLVLAGLLLAILIRQTWVNRVDRSLSRPSSPSLTSPSLEPKRSLRLFYASPEEDSLQEEIREVEAGRGIDEEARTALAELIQGPHTGLLSPIPPGTRLRQVYIDGQGVAYADFSPELRDHHPGGSRAELLSIYCIVDTLAYNFEQIKMVKILIDGSEVDTLAGHIDLRRPLKPRIDFGKPG